MNGLVICNIGLETISLLEIKELIKVKGKEIEGGVEFEFDKYEDLFKLCYLGKSFFKVICIINAGKFEYIKDIKVEGYKEWNAIGSFAVRSEIVKNKIESSSIQKEVGGMIVGKVNLTKPDIQYFIYVNSDSYYFGIDFSGEDLGKRPYRIFVGRDTLKATTGYGMLRYSGYNCKGVLLDPCCKSGVIVIEAGLHCLGKSVHYYNKDVFLFLRLPKFKDYNFEKYFEKLDSKIKKKLGNKIIAMDSTFQSISSTKKNAKIAGVQNLLTFSRTDLDWLDAKHEKGSIDYVVTVLPSSSKTVNKKDIEKLYREFFYQCDFVLSSKGKICIMSKDEDLIEKYSSQFKFKIKEKYIVHQGKERLPVLVIIR